MSEALMTIGDFAREAGLSAKALRVYDELGLLVPAEVDAWSGYRRYAPSQLERARTVAMLRLLGMPLARIRDVVDASDAAAAREVEAYWSQVEADTVSRRDIVTTLVRQWKNEESTMSTATQTLRAEVGTGHRQGRRERQQDAFLATPGLLAVADGFGDRDDLAAAALRAYARGGFAAAVAEVAPAFHEALPGQPSAGTTLTAVTLDGTLGRLTHVGDARVWLVRDGEVRCLTHDHTMVAALLDAGQLTEEEARAHDHRSLLNRALTPGVVPDEVEVELRSGDRLVLTTDGVHAHVDHLEPLLSAETGPQAVADALAAAVAAAGEPDNHTVVVADLG
ncbi:serine/threonine protein phosphatase [Marmoricola endophyticus]|uniref:Serine/threonine protein phosphatase n=1 Tax=Marmoricola endophyticus TaxID=2040280 RepID=A0A917BJ09_9ACTN|nr:MerR family transcriptional regulator [Marmoricola endophyticus]GGF46933.1 serine/threonine protein phosphatase [Marmoricola endophyticus]